MQLRAVLCGEPLSGAFLEGAEAEQPCVQVGLSSAESRGVAALHFTEDVSRRR